MCCRRYKYQSLTQQAALAVNPAAISLRPCYAAAGPSQIEQTGKTREADVRPWTSGVWCLVCTASAAKARVGLPAHHTHHTTPTTPRTTSANNCGARLLAGGGKDPA